MATTNLTSVVIEDDGNAVKLTWSRTVPTSVDVVQYVSKPYSLNECDISGSLANKAKDHAEMKEQNGERTKVYVHMVTSPVVADLAALMALLSSYNNTATGCGSSYSLDFVNGDLTAGVLTVNHALNTTTVAVEVVDNTGAIYTAPVTIVDVDNVTVDLSAVAPITGTWTVNVIA